MRKVVEQYIQFAHTFVLLPRLQKSCGTSSSFYFLVWDPRSPVIQNLDLVRRERANVGSEQSRRNRTPEFLSSYWGSELLTNAEESLKVRSSSFLRLIFENDSNITDDSLTFFLSVLEFNSFFFVEFAISRRLSSKSLWKQFAFLRNSPISIPNFPPECKIFGSNESAYSIPLTRPFMFSLRIYDLNAFATRCHRFSTLPVLSTFSFIARACPSFHLSTSLSISYFRKDTSQCRI